MDFPRGAYFNTGGPPMHLRVTPPIFVDHYTRGNAYRQMQVLDAYLDYTRSMRSERPTAVAARRKVSGVTD